MSWVLEFDPTVDELKTRRKGTPLAKSVDEIAHNRRGRARTETKQVVCCDPESWAYTLPRGADKRPKWMRWRHISWRYSEVVSLVRKNCEPHSRGSITSSYKCGSIHLQKVNIVQCSNSKTVKPCVFIDTNERSPTQAQYNFNIHNFLWVRMCHKT